MAGQADPIDRGRETLLRALREGDVRFVVIGGAALQSHGQRYETEDIDVTPDRAQQNLARLADVLNRLECRLEVDPAHPENAVSLPPDYFTASVLAQANVWKQALEDKHASEREALEKQLQEIDERISKDHEHASAEEQKQLLEAIEVAKEEREALALKQKQERKAMELAREEQAKVEQARKEGMDRAR
jgi:hypothetical protein